jgi:hypothetical protein
LVHRLISECYSDWAEPANGRATIRIISVTQAGDVANVLLDWDHEAVGNSWVDLHNLIRLNGTWKITNKTATHKSRAAGV